LLVPRALRVERNGEPCSLKIIYGGSEIKDGIQNFTMAVLKKLGWKERLTPDELAVISQEWAATYRKVAWSTDLSGGIQTRRPSAWLHSIIRQWARPALGVGICPIRSPVAS